MKNLLPSEKIKRKILIKKEAETSPDYGILPENRATEEIINYGIVNIDKPRGPTSHQVSAYVQNILKIKKAGHSGTLDPNVTGLLPIALGRATKIVQALLHSGKEYVAIMHLHKDVSGGKLKAACKEFVGKIKQLPPIKSSVKRELREREVYYLDILEIDGRDVLFKVGCQAGTYIRKLIHDIGQKLGCGAHMVELRRTKAGPFDESTLTTLQDLQDAYYYWKEESNDKLLRKIIQPVENGANHLPKIWVLDTTVDSLCHGANLNIPGISKVESDIKEGNLTAIMTLKNEIIAIGPANINSEEIMQKEKGMAVKASKVFMLPGTYPKIKIATPE